MPMRWTPDKDQLMFMMLLKTHNISINYGAIAESWPDDQGEKPTPRAISERLIKIRKQVSGGTNGAVKPPRSVNSTPSKPKAIRPPVSGSATTPSHKRRRVADDVDGDDRTISRKELRELGVNDPRSSPTPQQQPPFATTALAASSAAARRSTTVASTVMPSSERSPAPRAASNGSGESSASASASASSSSSRPALPPPGPATTATTAAAAAPRHRTSLSANANAFTARTPVSMEPTAGQLARLSVTPADGAGGGGAGSTPRRGTSMAPIKLEDDDVLQPDDLLDDDSDVSDWAEEYV